MSQNVHHVPTRAPSVFERHPRTTLIIVIVVSLAALALATEQYLALTRPYFSNPGIERYIRLREHPPRMFDYIRPDERQLRTSDSLTSKSYRFQVDENGFIHPSKIHEEPELEIMFLGGSTTENLLVEEKQRFPYLVGRIIERQGIKVNAYNGGVSGNNVLHSIDVLLNKVIPMRPDYVVLMHNINDLVVLLYEGSYWNDHFSRSLLMERSPPSLLFSVAKSIKDRFFPYLYTELKKVADFRGLLLGEQDEFARPRDLKAPVDGAALRRQFSTGLTLFIAICRAADIEPVLMTQANRFKSDPDPIIADSLRPLQQNVALDYAKFRSLYESFNQTIRDVGRETGVTIIDLAAAIPQDKAYLFDSVHFNENGSRLAAELIAGALLARSSEPEDRLTTTGK